MKGFIHISEKEKTRGMLAVVLGLFLSLLVLNGMETYAESIQNGISDKVVRFHVLANSDSREDQTVKLKVRDRILEQFSEELSFSGTKAEALHRLTEQKTALGEAARSVLREEGYGYDAEVFLVREPFPAKDYDGVFFPAGVYDALRIELGRAEGKNWWCVLYPSMCFVDAVWGPPKEEGRCRLKRVLSGEEYTVVSAKREKKAVPKLKLGIVEWWQKRETAGKEHAEGKKHPAGAALRKERKKAPSDRSRTGFLYESVSVGRIFFAVKKDVENTTPFYYTPNASLPINR